MNVRKYLPTTADLIDRLSIALLKSVHALEDRKVYLDEMLLIKHDVHVLGVDAELIYAVLVLMLANTTIWTNEDKARAGSGEQDHLLRFTHQINALRSEAKNKINGLLGDRIDAKINYMTIPENWRAWD